MIERNDINISEKNSTRLLLYLVQKDTKREMFSFTYHLGSFNGGYLYLNGPVIQYKKEPKLNRIVDWDCLSIEQSFINP